MEDLKSLLYTLAAAASGAYVSSVINPKPLTLTRRIVGGTAGILVAYWFAVPFASHFNIDDQRTVAAITFGFALLWEKVIALVSDFGEGLMKRVLNRSGDDQQ